MASRANRRLNDADPGLVEHAALRPRSGAPVPAGIRIGIQRERAWACRAQAVGWCISTLFAWCTPPSGLFATWAGQAGRAGQARPGRAGRAGQASAGQARRAGQGRAGGAKGLNEPDATVSRKSVARVSRISLARGYLGANPISTRSMSSHWKSSRQCSVLCHLSGNNDHSV